MQIQPVPAQRYQSYAGVLLQRSTAALGFLPNASYRVAGSDSLTNFQLEECATSVPPLAHLATSNRLAVTD